MTEENIKATEWLFEYIYLPLYKDGILAWKRLWEDAFAFTCEYNKEHGWE